MSRPKGPTFNRDYGDFLQPAYEAEVDEQHEKLAALAMVGAATMGHKNALNPSAYTPR